MSVDLVFNLYEKIVDGAESHIAYVDNWRFEATNDTTTGDILAFVCRPDGRTYEHSDEFDSIEAAETYLRNIANRMENDFSEFLSGAMEVSDD